MMTPVRMSRDLAVEQSLDAAMEMQDLISGKHNDAPKLRSLLKTLVGSPGAMPSRKELLSDARTTALYHRAADPAGTYKTISALYEILDLLVVISERGVASLSTDQLGKLRDFCLGLNRELVDEAFNRTPVAPLARRGRQSLIGEHVG